LTGNLEREIITNPFFFGKEKHYLRAQIARIYHGTTVVANGMFKLGEAAEEGGP
jgi:radial spoke head protein 4A